jgi:hypothetical protein
MTRSFALAIGLFIVSLIAFVPGASAQKVPGKETVPGKEWRHGTTLGVFAGSATASPDTRGTLGAALGWEINHRVELEGTGAWLVARHGDEAFAAELKVLANLTRPNTVVPYLGAGVGMYLATFDMTSGTLPAFYQQRVAGTVAGTQKSFVDPSFIFAGGCDIFASKHFSIRPEISVRLVTHGSDSYAVTMATVRVSYHVESHDVGR